MFIIVYSSFIFELWIFVLIDLCIEFMYLSGGPSPATNIPVVHTLLIDCKQII